MTQNKVKLAIVKFGGMSAGGTEKFLQNIAAFIDKNRFSVTFFYCDAAPYLGSDFVHPDTDPARVMWLEREGVSLVKFHVGAKDITQKGHPWIDTDFWEVFDEGAFDILQTARAGHPEFPFTELRKIAIVDSIHLNAGVHNQKNIAAVMSLSKWSQRQWIRRGGDPRKSVLVSHPIPDKVVRPQKNDRRGDALVFGMHQRPSDDIFSPIPLLAYSQIETTETRFLLMGGSGKYALQASDLGLRTFKQLPFSGKPEAIEQFLLGLDVYAHGRKDGEINSTAIAEALRSSLPIVSHHSVFNQGHQEIVARSGFYAQSLDDYVNALKSLADNSVRQRIGRDARSLFLKKYERNGQMRQIEALYSSVLSSRPPTDQPMLSASREFIGRGWALGDHLARAGLVRRMETKFSPK
jgi:glycosyltransferase involved in cell wall biosynthesis